jgi:hypothetical protein
MYFFPQDIRISFLIHQSSFLFNFQNKLSSTFGFEECLIVFYMSLSRLLKILFLSWFLFISLSLFTTVVNPFHNDLSSWINSSAFLENLKKKENDLCKRTYDQSKRRVIIIVIGIIK